MQPISDKNLDKLFKDRFENFEQEPPAALWNKIDSELNASRKRGNSKSIIWMSAASVLILLSATLYLYRPVEVIKLKGRENSGLQIAKKTDQPNKTDELEPTKDFQDRTITVYSDNSQKLSQSGMDTKSKYSAEPKPQVKVNKPATDEILIAENTPLKSENQIINAEVKAEPVLASTDKRADDLTENDENLPKRKVKGIGGLVNFVIAQVDKREDKLIEFKDSEEGSEISGINLGLVKFKSRNK